MTSHDEALCCYRALRLCVLREGREGDCEALGRVWDEVLRLRRQVEGHCERIAQQSELLSRRAEEL